MTARIVDFLGTESSLKMARYLEYLGFNVAYDDSSTQIGYSCGYIAAQNLASMQMRCYAPFDVDLSHSAHHRWVVEGNQILGGNHLRNPGVAQFLTETEVTCLVQAWLTEAQLNQNMDDEIFILPGEDQAYMTGISSSDFTLREVIEDIRDLNAHETFTRRPINPRNPFLRLRIPNTVNSDKDGTHWFTLAYSFELKVE